MRCPVCKNDMIVVEYGGIEMDHCLNCRGVWFDAGELDLLMKAAGMEGALSLPADEAKVEEKKRKCPICSHPLAKAHMGDKKVLVDICSRGDGIWFDGGELVQVIAAEACAPGETGDAQEKVMRFVAEAFQAEG